MSPHSVCNWLQICGVVIACGVGMRLPAPAGAAETIDLLKSLKPGEQRVAGDWTLSDGVLQVAAQDGARLMLPWTPTTEYDLEVEFTRQTGVHSIALIFVAGGRQASFDIDAWGQHLAGLQNINGRSLQNNSTSVRGITLENGRRYVAAVRVRKDRVEAVLDGKVITSSAGDGQNFSLLDLWALPRKDVPGIGAWNSQTVFHRIEVRPVDGSPPMPVAANSAGPTPATRPADSATSPLPTTRPSMAGRPPRTRSSGVDDLKSLGDEFEDVATLKNWLRVYQTEQTGADQLAVYDIGRSRRGALTLVPHASTWYQDYRGVLVYKEVSGDFVMTTQAHSTNRAGNGAPRSSYSLAGIMVRTPREITARTWRPGGENYIFLSHGSARQAGRFEFEVKTTSNSRSNLEVTPASGPDVVIQVVRVGPDFVLLKKDGSRPWEVHRRYRRPDMPEKLQVGLTVYTDYSTASQLPPERQNTQVIRGGNPDLKTEFEYVRYQRPQIPADWQGRSIADPGQISDAQILQVFGAGVAP